MRHAITLTHLYTGLKFLRDAFFSTSRRPTNALALRTPKSMFYWEVSKNFHCNYLLEMLMNGFSKNSNSLFLEHQCMPFDGWKKDYREMNNCSKVILVQNKWAQSCIGHQCFNKKNCKGKIKFCKSMLIPRCQCRDFQMVFKMCPW